MSEPSPQDLSFERADVGFTFAPPCDQCQQPLTGTYFGWNGTNVCPSCHEALAKQHAGPGSFLFALVYGSLAAALGAGVYYGIAAATGMEFGLIAIVVGIAVGKAVRLGAGSIAQKRYRALAIFLTYASITATYVPFVLQDVEDIPLIAAVAIAFISPALMLISFENLLGLLILGIGVYEAWKLSAPPALVVQGPFTVAAPSPVAAAADGPHPPAVPG